MATRSAMHLSAPQLAKSVYLPLICSMLVVLLFCGCNHVHDASQLRSAFVEANGQYHTGDFTAALNSYQQIVTSYPAASDRALFEMGILHASRNNPNKDYQKALSCFQQIVFGYPESAYRKDSEMMLFSIKNVMLKDMTIATRQEQLDALRRQLQDSGSQIRNLQQQMDILTQQLKSKDADIVSLRSEVIALQKGVVDKLLIEKKARRLTLFSQGKLLKSYQIALGGNPHGPKERRGDHKTPEGIYTIDARNMNSQYHLSLHISYPNEQDRKRAKKSGMDPGGDIMIHGIKNGFSWVGERHAETDWTRGCIAVTDDEIEEIARLVPNGATVEIRP